MNSVKKDVWENIIGLVVIIIVILVAVYFLDFENIQEKILAAGVWGPVLLILAKASTLVFAPLSGAALYPIAGAVFGFGPGFTYIVLGDALGAVVSFGISRKFGQKIVEKMLSRKNLPTAKKIMKMMETTVGFIFARVCFSPMPEIVSYAAGLTRINFWKFFIIHNFIGLFPSFILVLGGDLLVSQLHNPKIIFGILALGTIAVIGGGILFWKFSKYFIPEEEKISEENSALQENRTHDEEQISKEIKNER